MAAPPDDDRLGVAAAAEATPSNDPAMSTDAPARRAIREMSRYDKHNPFSFCAYGVSCRARAERVRYAGNFRRFAPRSRGRAPMVSPLPGAVATGDSAGLLSPRGSLQHAGDKR